MFMSNALLFIPIAYTFFYSWIVNAVLFGVLALMYLAVYCRLNYQMSNIAKNHDGLYSERSKMRTQFYLFGFAYLAKCIIFAVETSIWN